MQRTEEQRFEARQEAARGAVNIDREERQRRLVFGSILLVGFASNLENKSNMQRAASTPVKVVVASGKAVCVVKQVCMSECI